MKLLFIFNIGFDKGGPSVHLLKSVLEGALGKGHQCHVILKKTCDAEYTGLEELTEKYTDLTISMIKKISGKSGFVKRYIDDCKYALECRRHYKGQAYDAVFLQSCNVAWVYMAGLKHLKCPIVFNVQDIFPQNLMFSNQLPVSTITYPLFSYLQRVAYRKAARIITISDDMKQTLVECGIDPDKIDVIYNWSYADGRITLDELPAERVFDLKADEKKTNVIYAGNIGKMQNVELIARTALLSRDDDRIHYYIIGDGANKSQVEEIVDGLDNVTVLPMQPAVYAESIYAQADINVIPLAKGGIKTALPSKTATVLRTDKCVVFCIDANSKFEGLMNEIGNVRVTDNVDPSSLYHVICELRESKNIQRTEGDGGVSAFSTSNALRYSEIMESAANQKNKMVSGT